MLDFLGPRVIYWLLRGGGGAAGVGLLSLVVSQLGGVGPAGTSVLNGLGTGVVGLFDLIGQLGWLAYLLLPLLANGLLAFFSRGVPRIWLMVPVTLFVLAFIAFYAVPVYDAAWAHFKEDERENRDYAKNCYDNESERHKNNCKESAAALARTAHRKAHAQVRAELWESISSVTGLLTLLTVVALVALLGWTLRRIYTHAYEVKGAERMVTLETLRLQQAGTES